MPYKNKEDRNKNLREKRRIIKENSVCSNSIDDDASSEISELTEKKYNNDNNNENSSNLSQMTLYLELRDEFEKRFDKINMEHKEQINKLENKIEKLQDKFNDYKDEMNKVIINLSLAQNTPLQFQPQPQPIIIQQPTPITTTRGSYNTKLKTENNNIILEEPTKVIEEIKQPKEKAVKLSKKEKDELELEQLKMPITFEEFYDYIEIFESDFEIDGICYNDGNRRNYYKNVLKRAVESVQETFQDLPIQATNLRNKIFYVRTDKLKQKEQYINDKNKWIYNTKDNLLRIEMLHSKITEKLNLLRVNKMMECNENDNSEDEDDDDGNVLKLNGTVAGEAMKYKTDYLKDSDDLYGFCNLILPLFKMEGTDI